VTDWRSENAYIWLSQQRPLHCHKQVPALAARPHEESTWLLAAGIISSSAVLGFSETRILL